MNAPTPPSRKVAKPRTKRPRKPLVALPAEAQTTKPNSQEPAPVVDRIVPTEETPVKDVPSQPTVSEPPTQIASPTETLTPPLESVNTESIAPSIPPTKEEPTAPESRKQGIPPEVRRKDKQEMRRDERRQVRETRREESQARDGHQQGARYERREEPERDRGRPQEMGPQTRGLTLLGSKTTVYSDRYTPAILETFENRHPENDYFVKFNCPEFTSLCPITGQPDFATIYISYIPDRRMVESKSLKLYLFGFRNHGAFHEDCVNTIMKDLIKLMAPRYIEVWGRFLPRGGLSIDPYANYGRPTTRWEEFARQRLLMHDLNPERVDNR